jgi:uncharacterized membrane protein YfcA
MSRLLLYRERYGLIGEEDQMVPTVLVAILGMLLGHIVSVALLGHVDDSLGAWSVEVLTMILILVGYKMLIKTPRPV